MTGWDDVEVRMSAGDGWTLGGLLRVPADDHPMIPAAVLVPGSRHERDAYTTLVDALEACGIASLRIDVRGRGTSRGDRPYARMAPGQRRAVVLDVAAALDELAGAPAVDDGRLAVVAEQDTTAAAMASLDRRVRAVVLLSPRGDQLRSPLAGGELPVFGLVSSEDREGMRAATDAYLAGADGTSRLEVLKGLGFGTTMFSTRQFDHPDAEPLETMIADWLATRLT